MIKGDSMSLEEIKVALDGNSNLTDDINIDEDYLNKKN